MKKFSLLLAMLMLASLMLTACGQSASSSAASESQPAESTSEPAEEDEENYETGDASLDDPRNGDEIGEKELLVVSFGTSFNDSRRLTIGAVEGALEKAFPEYAAALPARSSLTMWPSVTARSLTICRKLWTAL